MYKTLKNRKNKKKLENSISKKKTNFRKNAILENFLGSLIR